MLCPAVAAVRRRGQSCPAAHLGIGVPFGITPSVNFFIPLLWCEEFPSCAVISCVLPTLSSPTLRLQTVPKYHNHRWVMILWKLETAKKQNPCGLGAVLHARIKWLTVAISAIKQFFLFSHVSHSWEGLLCFHFNVYITYISKSITYKAWVTKLLQTKKSISLFLCLNSVLIQM